MSEGTWRPRIAGHLLIFGSRPDEDLDGVLAAVAAAGYAGIELAGHRLVRDAEILPDLLAKHQLTLAGVHLRYDLLDTADRVLVLMPVFDCRNLLCSGKRDWSMSDDYRRAAAAFADVGRRAAAAGCVFSYHHHAWELVPLEGGASGLDVILGQTDPSTVKLGADTYWLAVGGVDPAAYLREMGDRVVYVHLKDRRDGTYAEVGQGELDFPAIATALAPARPAWLTVEQDTTTREPAESIAMSRRYIRDRLGF